MARSKVVVIGAGVGGLAAAVRLAARGYEVEVFEKAGGPGGRCGRLELGPYRFDTGPTLLLMPEVLAETFGAVGRRVEQYLELVKCEPNYEVRFADGSALTFSTDLSRMGPELERLEPGAFHHYLKFLAMGREQYRVSLERFVGRNFSSALEYLEPATLRSLFRIRALKNMYREVSRYFRDPRLRAALTFQTMYLGISPFESPAVYGLLPFTELAMGIWYPRGGLYQIPLALERLARELGVRIHYGTAVERILTDGRRARGVLLAGGDRVAADALLCNADLPWAYRRLLAPGEGAPPRANVKYTSSAFLAFFGTRRRYPELLHHNVVLGADYRGSFTDIFDRLRIPAEPSFYLNAPARTDPTVAPAGGDALYLLVPVPHLGADLDWASEGPRLRDRVLERLRALGGPDIAADVEVERFLTPRQFADELNLERGSAFGLSHHFRQVGALRPANQDARIRNLFFVGASTQPGTGLPMVMLSARLVTERIAAQLPVRGESLSAPGFGGSAEAA